MLQTNSGNGGCAHADRDILQVAFTGSEQDPQSCNIRDAHTWWMESNGIRNDRENQSWPQSVENCIQTLPTLCFEALRMSTNASTVGGSENHRHVVEPTLKNPMDTRQRLQNDPRRQPGTTTCHVIPKPVSQCLPGSATTTPRKNNLKVCPTSRSISFGREGVDLSLQGLSAFEATTCKTTSNADMADLIDHETIPAVSFVPARTQKHKSDSANEEISRMQISRQQKEKRNEFTREAISSVSAKSISEVQLEKEAGPMLSICNVSFPLVTSSASTTVNQVSSCLTQSLQQHNYSAQPLQKDTRVLQDNLNSDSMRSNVNTCIAELEALTLKAKNLCSRNSKNPTVQIMKCKQETGNFQTIQQTQSIVDLTTKTMEGNTNVIA